MTTFLIEQPFRKPIAVTRRGRPGGVRSIQQIQLHATRGPTTLDKQVEATVNWFADNRPFPDGNNHGAWGSSADYVVGPFQGRTVIFEFGDPFRTFGSWSAGYGRLGVTQEHGAAEVGIAIEIAQVADGDAFENDTINALVWLCQNLNDRIDAAGGERIPAVRIREWDQLRSKPIPRGYIGHDALANGQKTGKSDPGAAFPWPRFLEGVQDLEARLSPPITNTTAAIAAWRNGVIELPMMGQTKRYELRI